MRIAVFGATGGIGRFVVKHALSQGHEVRAYVRNPGKLQLAHARLSVIAGELTDRAAIEKAISGCDAVISAIGIPLKLSYPAMESLEGHENIIAAMQKLGVSRLIDWSTPAVRFPSDEPSLITVVPRITTGIVPTMAKKELVAVSEAIQASGLNWTVVRFVAPTDAPGTGKYQVGFGERRMGLRIPREDIAAFMLEQVRSDAYSRSMPIIGS
jgi:putative NADH-flavin reductase